MQETTWTETIQPRDSLFSLKLREVWRYRDLLWMFVVRDFITLYKQTILGPIWLFIQPIFTTFTFTIIFGMLAGISTDTVPKPLFYLAGLVCWGYFSECLLTTTEVFRTNQQIFGKVYFPRIVVPLSIAVSRLMKFAIQIGLFMTFYLIYYFRGADLHPNLHLLWSPFLVFLLACLSLSFGMIISSMTTKYRDLVFLITFGIQLWDVRHSHHLSLIPGFGKMAMGRGPQSDHLHRRMLSRRLFRRIGVRPLLPALHLPFFLYAAIGGDHRFQSNREELYGYRLDERFA